MYTYPEEAAAKGKASRQLMVSKYSPEAVAAAIAVELARINGMLRCGRGARGCAHSTNPALEGGVDPRRIRLPAFENPPPSLHPRRNGTCADCFNPEFVATRWQILGYRLWEWLKRFWEVFKRVFVCALRWTAFVTFIVSGAGALIYIVCKRAGWAAGSRSVVEGSAVFSEVYVRLPVWRGRARYR